MEFGKLTLLMQGTIKEFEILFSKFSTVLLSVEARAYLKCRIIRALL